MREQASQRLGTAELISNANSAEKNNEWAARAKEQMDKHLAQYFHTCSCLFWTIVRLPRGLNRNRFFVLVAPSLQKTFTTRFSNRLQSFFPLSCGTSKRSRDSTHWLGVWPGLMSFCFTVSTTHWSSGTIGSNHWPLAASQGPMLAGYKWPHERRFMTIAFRRHLRNKSISISTVKVASCYMPLLFSNSHQIQKETFVYLTKV